MSHLSPCKRREFIRRLRVLGFTGPVAGTRHQMMVLGSHRIAIPGYEEYSVPKLAEMLREVSLLLERDVAADTWNRL